MVRLAAAYPRETLLEIRIYRWRPTMVPVYEAVIKLRSDRYTLEALQGLERMRVSLPKSDAAGALVRALSGDNREAKFIASVLIGDRMKQQSVPVLRQLLREDVREGSLFAAALVLEKCVGVGALPGIRKACERMAKGRSPHSSDANLMIVRARMGDASALPRVRSLALQKGNPHIALIAIDNLASRYGLQEKATLRKALFSGAAQRHQASRWLLALGDRGAAKVMRQAAKVEPFDVKNSGGFPEVNGRLLKAADLLDRGERAPRPAPYHKDQKPIFWWGRG
jgi:hypothetical protein